MILCDYFEHLENILNFLTAKYGQNTEFILCADSNRLDLTPIIDLNSNFQQVVQIPTRLNPPAVLDTIVTSISKFYEDVDAGVLDHV